MNNQSTYHLEKIYSSTESSSFMLSDIIKNPQYPPLLMEQVLNSIAFPYKKGMCFLSLQFSVEPSPQKIKTTLAQMRSQFPDSIYTFYDKTIVFLIGNTDHRFENKILTKLQFLHHQTDARLGISHCFHELWEMYRHFQQSCTALEYAHRFVNAGHTNYTLYENVQQLEFFKQVSAHVNLTDYCSDDILKLLKYDSENHSDYAQTLYVYLRCFGDGVGAASKLKIHKNSLYYRLNVIKKLLDYDLTDGETNYTYMFAFRALEVIGIFQPLDL